MNYICFAVPLVLEMCSSVIEEHGIVDGIYRLSGITSNMQRLRYVPKFPYYFLILRNLGAAEEQDRKSIAF